MGGEVRDRYAGRAARLLPATEGSSRLPAGAVGGAGRLSRTATAAIPVIVNPGGGGAASRGERLRADLASAFAAAGLAAEVRLVEGCDVKAAIDQAATKAPTIVVGGGDGTLGCAAGALLAGNASAVLGVLPLGTRNHLAGELGIPADLAAAARLIAEGTSRRIDVGQVNDRYFVNNASIGLYPALVERRDAIRGRAGLPKWLANLPAAWAAIGRVRHHRLEISLEGERTPVRTPLLFIGNNRYALDLSHLGRRERLDEGVLSLFAVGPRSRTGLVGMALRLLAGRGRPDDDFAALGTPRAATVRLHGQDIRVALDGEVIRLAGPLRFACLPAALEVIAPVA